MKRRCIAMLLCISIICSMIIQITPFVYATEKNVYILNNEEQIDQLVIPQDEKELLTVETQGINAVEYQWQILLDKGNQLWIDIYDAKEPECTVSYALVKNLLDESDMTSIRCMVYDTEMRYYSEPVEIQITAAENIGEGKEEEPKILVSDMIVLEKEKDPFVPEGPMAPVATPSVATPSVATPSVATPAAVEREDSEGPGQTWLKLIPRRRILNLPVATPSNADATTEGNGYSGKLMLGNAKNSTEYVTITIKYLDESSLTSGVEAAVYNPYVARIEYGQNFAQNIVSPTFLGFAPYYDGDGDGVINEESDADDASMIELDLTNVTEDIEIKIYYMPIEVDFAVRYYFQNINDDFYNEDVKLYHTAKAETGTIVSDEYLKEHAGDTAGFTKMYHIPQSVAADGSTVFECYYDRNYYLLQFDLAGGYGVDPIYARYDAPFIVNDPVYPGYIFRGWDLLDEDMEGDGIADDFPTTIPKENRYYRALWQTVNTTATVAYWLEDPNEEGRYNYWGGYEISALSGQTLNGKDYESYDRIGDSLDYYEKKYSYFNESLSDEDVTVKGDGSSVINVYYDRNEYTLKFYYASSVESPSSQSNERLYSIVGGSTYFFGQEAGPTNDYNYNQLDEVDLLDYTKLKSSWGTITDEPSLNATGASRDYTFGTTESKRTSGLLYHYLSFTAKYGADLSELWPCSIFEPAERVYANTHGQWSGKTAYVSAWNGEYQVYYSQRNANETIKGNYQKLDHQLLFDMERGYADSDTVCYLCFWENGANVDWSIPKLWVYKLWVQLRPGEDTSGLTLTERYGVTYKLLDSYDTCDNSEEIKDQTQVALEGYKVAASPLQEEMWPVPSGYQKAFIANFYYASEINELAFYNYNEYVPDKGGQTSYGTPMDSMFFVPDYPSNLEEHAYDFAGWYTTSECLEGSEFGNFVYDSDGGYVDSDFNGWTMIDGSLTLYAKWVPKLHRVNFFTSYEELLQYEADEAASVTSSVTPYKVYDEIEHGKVVGSIENPEKVGSGDMKLIFAGWFYMENGSKKAFSPLNMPVNRNMNIFADWSSSQPQPYRISYVLERDPNVKVAEDTAGFAYGGSTRTFIAKAGDPYSQLYSGYNTGYFPTLSSHSIVINYEEDKDNPTLNVHTFYYVEAANVEYTVRYVNKETNTLMEEMTVKTTSDAVVTERFKAFPNYVPDAFYKRLVIAVEKDPQTGNWVGSEDNVITFYYMPNKTNAYYAVHYMLEKLGATDADRKNYAIDGSGGYEESGTHVEGVGDIDSDVSIIPQTFAGFEMINNNKVPNLYVGGVQQKNPSKYTDGQYQITIKKEGTELYIFYKRLAYDYTVHYYKYNTNDPVSSSEIGQGQYDSEVIATAKTIPGYTCVSDLTKTITIRDKEAQNVIIFYYSPLQYVAEYIAVPENGGSLSTTIEVITGAEALTGSVPTAEKYYQFEGWYLDEACTQSAATKGIIGAGNRFTPSKAALSETERNIFYAKFVLLAGNLTINRAVDDAEDEDQVFVYEVENLSTGQSIYVTITGTDTVTIHNLPYGQYRITQLNEWSWRYNAESSVISFDKNQTVHFGGNSTSRQWINGNSAVKVNQRR